MKTSSGRWSALAPSQATATPPRGSPHDDRVRSVCARLGGRLQRRRVDARPCAPSCSGSRSGCPIARWPPFGGCRATARSISRARPASPRAKRGPDPRLHGEAQLMGHARVRAALGGDRRWGCPPPCRLVRPLSVGRPPAPGDQQAGNSAVHRSRALLDVAMGGQPHVVNPPA